MAEYHVKGIFKHRRDTSSNWTTKNPIILDGEIILVDTSAGDIRVKVGDGTKHYSELPFLDEKINVGTAYRALITDASGRLSASSVTSTELGYMSGVTSAVQTQLDNKVPNSRTINEKALTSNITLSAEDVNAQPKITVNGIVQGDGSGNLSAVETINADLLDLTPAAVGLGNVDNVKQYSVENPPPYPVTSVNGQTGAVAVPATFVINRDSNSGDLDKTFDEFESAYRAGYVCVICENYANTKKLWTLARFDDEGEFSVAVFARQDGGDMSTLEWDYGSTTITDSIDTILYTGLTADTATNRYYPTSKAVWNAIPHPAAKTSTQTQAVGVDSDGKLWTAPAPVTSVNNKTGTVSLTANDVGALPLTGGYMSGSIDMNYNSLNNTDHIIFDANDGVRIDIYPEDDGYVIPRLYTEANGEEGARITVGTPMIDNDAATKAYVDGKALPSVTATDNGKFLRVSNGAWAVETVPSAEGVSF